MPVLGIDLGGSKILAALTDGPNVLERAETATDREAGPSVWLDQIDGLVRNWPNRFHCAGLAVTGLVREGMWSALNPETLGLTDPFPLAEAAQARLQVPVRLANDAQAAAWGEFRHGAGAGRDLVFLTISTGIGGGIVSGGQLISGASGLAGNVGQLLPIFEVGDATLFEETASGRWIAAQAGEPDARSAFAKAAEDPNSIAATAIARSAERVARLCTNLQLLVDPEIIVIGGGVGLAPGYLDRVKQAAATASQVSKILPAKLGAEAGVIGIAALAEELNESLTNDQQIRRTR
ncbi:MAG: ROK family protein [Pseudomonadota bacterium]